MPDGPPPSRAKRLPSGRWQIRYEDQNGQSRRETFDTAREANDRKALVTRQVQRGIFIDAAKRSPDLW